jgi:hypothetical protein
VTFELRVRTTPGGEFAHAVVDLGAHFFFDLAVGWE